MGDRKEMISVLYIPSKDKKQNQSTENALKKQSCGKDKMQIVKTREDAPLAEAYNRFLKEAKGELLTVVNAGDTFDEPYFAQVLDLFAEYGGQTALFMTNKDYYFAGTKRKRPFLPDKLPEARILVDLWERAQCDIVPVFLNGTFIRTETAVNYPMKPALGLEAEKEMLLRMTLDCHEVLYAQDLLYRYETPRDAHHYVFPGAHMESWYYQSFSEFFLPFMKEVKERYGAVPRYLQYVLAHAVVCRLAANMDNRNKRVVHEDGETYMRSLSPVLAYVDDEVLADVYHCPTYTPDLNLRLLLARLKRNDANLQYDYFAEDGKVVGKLHGVPFFSTDDVEAVVHFIEYRDGKWEIDCRMKSYFPMERSTYYVTLDGQRYALRYEERFSHTMYFGCTVCKYHTFHVSVPIDALQKPQKLCFWIECAGRKVKLALNLKLTTSRLPNKAQYGYWRFDRYIAYRVDKDIVIRRAKKWYTCYREMRIWMEWLRSSKRQSVYYVFLRMMYFLTRPYYGRKTIWLFLDKIYKGGDSSEYLYKYIEKQKDGICSYYLLDEKSADYKRMKREGYQPLKRGSLKHKLVFLNADMVIASNSTVFAFNGFPEALAGYIKDLTRFHVVCVQHGMSVQNIARAQSRLKDNTRLYFCASKYEIQNLSRPVYNYVGYDALRLTGVPRYDGLIDAHKKQILISPTWRMQSSLMMTRNEGEEREYNPYFKDSDYFRIYNSLINDARLIEAAKKHGYRIAYVLHPIVSPQAKDFDRNDYVDIIPSVGDMSYEKLFCESSLMVTDYSGVQFDFAYMRKPLVYLHHNDIPKHYDEGVFTYATMAFGEICHTNGELIDVLCRYMEEGCVMKEMYRRRADDFFAFNDHHNCERIYKEMIDYQRRVVDKVH